MPDWDFTPDEEDQLDRELTEASNRQLNYQSTLSQRTADTFGEYQRKFSFVDPVMLMPTVQAVAEGRMSQEQADKFLVDFQKRAILDRIARGSQMVAEQEKKSWFERNVQDKIKTASRYTFAGLNFFPQWAAGSVGNLVTGGGSDGWFISTDLGSLIANDEVAGSGYFIGGRAKEYQADRERRYRGTIAGSSWTFGRGLASVFTEPGTREYHILSGLTDAAYAIFTPSVPGSKLIPGATRAITTATGLKTIAGLTKGSSQFIDTAKVADFLNSTSGRKVVSRLADVKSVDEAAAIFSRGDARFWVELVDAAEQVRNGTNLKAIDNLLTDTLGLEDVTRGVAARNIQDINIGRWDDMKYRLRSSGNWVGRLMNEMPGQHLVLIGGTDADVANTVKNVTRYMRQIRADDVLGAGTTTKLVDDFTRALVNNDGSIRNVVDEFNAVQVAAFKAMGVPDQVIKDLTAGVKNFTEIADRRLFGAIADNGDSADFGAKFVAQVDGETIVADMPLNTAGLQSEMLKHSLILPDARRVRRLATNLGWIKTGKFTGKTGRLGDVDRIGELRTPLVVIEAMQNYIWRPFTLLTGGYVLRNMSDSLLRQTFAPNVQLGAFHPLQLIQIAMHKRFKGDVLGVTFKGDPEDLIRVGQKELVAATNQTLREIDPVSRYARMQKTDAWRTVTIDDGIENYSKGVAAELNLLFDDAVSRLVAQGKTTDEIIEFLTTDPDGIRYVDNLINRWSNRTLTNRDTGERVVGSVMFRNADGSLHDDNIRKFVDEYIRPRLDSVTGNNAGLKDVVASGKFAGGTIDAFRYSRTGEIIGYDDDFLSFINDLARGNIRVEARPMSIDEYVQRAIENKKAGFNYENDPELFEKAYEYLGQNFPQVQNYLRGTWEPSNIRERLALDEIVKSLDVLISRAPKLDRPIVVYRGVKTTGYYNEYATSLKNMKPGDRFTEKGFISTSVDPEMAEGFSRNGIILEIEVPANQSVLTGMDFRANPARNNIDPEREMILPRNAQLQIVEVDGNRIVARIVDGQNVGNLKKTYKSAIEVGVRRTNDGTPLDLLKAAYDKTVDKFFGELYPRREAFLNRSPVFRQQYYATIDEYLENLAQTDLQTMVARLKKVADDAGEKFTERWLSNYVGSPELAKRIIDGSNGKIVLSGNLTLDQLDAYAKGFALDETKKLFYNAAEKSNFADILRIIAPFGSAWAEVTKNWARMLSRDPEILKRGGVTVQGLQEADPDGDGRGFFWKDPQTGEYVFNYPFGEWQIPFMATFAGAVGGGILGGARGAAIGAGLFGGAGVAAQTQLGGISPQFVAPVKTLNMGFNVLPGIGPYAQVAANFAIGDKPEADFLRKLLLPYGPPKVGVVTAPSYLDKLYAAFIADPENDRVFADMKMETMRVLSMSGDYDLSDPAQREALERDANNKARILLAFRAIGQFTGPTRPTVDFKVERRNGKITLEGKEIDLSQTDLYAGELSKYFRQLQVENYDTAVERFLDTFGEDAFLYVAGKTKATVGGLDASEEFGQWERSNSEVFNRYENVAGYFAPTGTNFDYQVYLRQIETGKRERLSPDELVEEAQRLVGVSAYRSVVRAAGPRPNAAQQEVLSEVRAVLEQQYPGFARAPLDINQQKARIAELEQAAFDSLLDDNEVAQALRAYFEVRTAVLDQIAVTGGPTTLQAQANAEFAAVLRDVGEQLARQVPQFERVWDRLLFNEVDLPLEAR